MDVKRPADATDIAIQSGEESFMVKTQIPNVSDGSDGLKFSVGAESVKVVGWEGPRTEFTIPASVNGKPVTIIGRGAFKGNEQVTSVSIPQTVTSLGAEAFAGCSALETVELPTDLEVINAQAFEGCTSLRKVYLPYELKRIASRAFAGCTSLKELPHFVKTGISVKMTVSRNLVERAFPIALEYIGSEAFKDCSALRKVVVPFKVTRLRQGVFEGCLALETVWLHSNLERIGSQAFFTCPSLKRLRVPASVQSVGENAFTRSTLVVTEEGSSAHRFAIDTGYPTDVLTGDATSIDSAMGARGKTTVADVLNEPEVLQNLIDKYEVRPPVDEVDRTDEADSNATPIRPARFEFDGQVYRSVSQEVPAQEITIAMTGDLMCSSRQQRSALDADGVYDFTESFEAVKPLLDQYDLAIGNLETMVAEAYPYMHRKVYADDRPHMNAPFAYLAAVRQAGIDVAINAQNHMYDTGAKGVLQTLDALNRAQIIHGGMYAGPDEPRYLLLDVKGFRVGIVAYLDDARQKNKQANFTEEGLQTLAAHFDADRIRKDIAGAREAGAEFVLAYCHWGREYTDFISPRQEAYAAMVADGGADYIFGSHSHCPQPYSVVRSSDNRRVPVVYSGGNFLSENNRKPPITRDSFIASLTLARDEQDRVIVKGDGYIPCRILEDQGNRGLVKVIPCEDLAEGAYGYDALQANGDMKRIDRTMGAQYRQLGKENFRADQTEEEFSSSHRYSDYEIQEPAFAELRADDVLPEPSFKFDEEQAVWRKTEDTALNEATLVCAGTLAYGVETEAIGRVGDKYQFRSMFKHVADCLGAADIAIGSFNSIVADNYPSISVMSRKHAGRHYMNARSEYIEALNYAGFDCLALANPYNLDLGVAGIAATEEAFSANGVVPSGLGSQKAPVFEVNGIRVAVLSFTLDMYGTRNVITHEGAEKLLSVFDAHRASEVISEVRERGADFVLSYLDCRSATGAYRLAERTRSAKELAEAGADYVICSHPVISRYTRFQTTDGREVPLATSLGVFSSGQVRNPENTVAPLLRVVLRRTATGAVEVEDSFIPMRRFVHYRGASSATVPATPYYTPGLEPEQVEGAVERLSELLGESIKVHDARRVTPATGYEPQLSPAQIEQILGVEFTDDARRMLRGQYDTPLTRVSIRTSDLADDCAAVIATRTTWHHFPDKVKRADAEKVKARMVIAEKQISGIPTLVVEDPWDAYLQLMAAVREKYTPLTIAVTGTAGKTTSKDMLGVVMRRHYKTLHVVGNGNTVTRSGNAIQKLASEHEAFIQEVHEGTTGSASAISKLIRPNICLVTSVGEGHLDQMGSIREVIEGNLQVADGMVEGGTLVLNGDSEHLRNVDVGVKVVRFGVSDPNFNYYATNVRSTPTRTYFNVVSPEGEYACELRVKGIHNVSNALGVFAVASIAGVPPHKIIAGLSRYEPTSVRQNVVEHGGYTLLIDAYNSNVLSLTSALEVLNELPVSEHGRRVAVLGDMGEQGSKVQENHEFIGQKLGELNIDLLLCTGGGMRYTASVAGEHAIEVRHFDLVQDLNHAVAREIHPGDAILFKAAGSASFTDKVIYPLFGRIV